MDGLLFPPLQLRRDGAALTLQGIYQPAGISLHVELSSTLLPGSAGMATVVPADLHRWLTAMANRDTTPDVTIYGIIATRLPGETNDRTEGLMFEMPGDAGATTNRQGFAVFASIIRDDPDELFLTVAHELAHCFNVHHSDWDGDTWSKATIESYCDASSVLWRLSERTITHFRSDPREEIWPGPGGWPWAAITPQHLSRHQPFPDDPKTFTTPAGLRISSQANPSSLRLAIELPKREYALGEPVVATIGLHNDGITARDGCTLLDPAYTRLTMEICGSTGCKGFHPGVNLDVRHSGVEGLPPGQAKHAEVPFILSADGATFVVPGDYELRARLTAIPPEHVDASHTGHEERIVAATRLHIRQPRSRAERIVADTLLSGRLATFLQLEGGAEEMGATKELEALVARCPGCPQLPTVQVRWASALLNQKEIDPARIGPTLDRSIALLTSALRDRELPARGLAQVTDALDAATDGMLPKQSVAADPRSRLAYQKERVRLRRAVKALRRAVGDRILDNESTEDIRLRLRFPSRQGVSTGCRTGPSDISAHYSRNDYPRHVGKVQYCIVAEGDTLWGLALRRLGSGSRWREITHLNPHLVNVDSIFPGDPIIMPR